MHLQADYAGITALWLGTRFPKLIHLHKFHFIVVCMLYFEGLRIRYFIHASATHLSHFTPHGIAQATTSVPVSILRMVRLTGGFRCTHDARKEADKDDADRGKAGANNADVDLNV